MNSYYNSDLQPQSSYDHADAARTTDELKSRSGEATPKVTFAGWLTGIWNIAPGAYPALKSPASLPNRMVWSTNETSFSGDRCFASTLGRYDFARINAANAPGSATVKLLRENVDVFDTLANCNATDGVSLDTLTFASGSVAQTVYLKIKIPPFSYYEYDYGNFYHFVVAAGDDDSLPGEFYFHRKSTGEITNEVP